MATKQKELLEEAAFVSVRFLFMLWGDIVCALTPRTCRSNYPSKK